MVFRSSPVVEHVGDCAVVFLFGDVDLTVKAEILESFQDAIALAKVPHLIVELSGVTLWDSSGLGTLAAALERIEARGGTLSVAGASARIVRLLQIVHLDASIDVMPRASLWSGSTLSSSIRSSRASDPALA